MFEYTDSQGQHRQVIQGEVDLKLGDK